MKRLLLIAALLIALLACVVAATWWWLTATRSGAQWALSQADRFVDTLEWSRLEGGLAGGLVLHDLHLEHQGLVFHGRRIELAARIRPLPSPAVRIDWLRGHDLDLILPETAADPPEPEPFVLPDDLSSPVPIRLDELLVRTLRIQTADHADPDAAITIDRLRLVARYDERAVIEQLAVEALGWTLHGNLAAELHQPYPLQTDLELTGRLLEHPQSATLALGGRLDQLTLELHTGGQVEARVTGSIRDLPTAPAFDATITSESADWPDLPGRVAALHAQLSGTPDDWRLAAELAAELTLPGDTETRHLTSHWQLRAAGDTQHATLRDTRIHLLDGTIAIDASVAWSDAFDGQASVTFQQLDFTALYPQWPDQLPISGHIRGRYDASIIALDTIELSAPPSPMALSGNARIDAAGDTVSADIQWQNLTWPPLPDDRQTPLFHSRQGRVLASGNLSDWRVELEALFGTGFTPEGTLDASVKGTEHEFTVENLVVDIGDNRLQAASSDNETINYHLAAGNLAQLHADARGEFDLHGSVQPGTPAWSAVGTGHNLGWAQMRLASLSLDSQGSLAANSSQLDTRIILQSLSFSPTERIDQLDLRIEGSCGDHRIEWQADTARANARLAGTASLAACPPDFGSWQAEWQRLDLLETMVGDWQLAGPATSRISADGDIGLTDLCLSSSEDEQAHLCIANLQQQQGSGRLSASLARLPANLLLGLSDAGIRLTSRIDGQVDASWQGTALDHVAAQIDISRGWLRQHGTEAALRVEGGTVQVHDRGPDGLSIDAAITVEGDSRLQADVDLDGIRIIEHAVLTGTASASIPELAHFARLAPELDALEGSLNAAFELTGPLTAPDIRGHLNLLEGRVQSVPFGLDLTAITLQAQTANGGLSLTGGFNAGEGRAELSGALTPHDGAWRVNTQLRGHDLKLFDADWLQLRASPDFTVNLSGERIEIDGRIDIPVARLGLPPGSVERISASGDIVVVGADRTDAHHAPPIPLHGRLVIGLGDDVLFRDLGAQARIAGELELQWRGGDDPVPLGRGALRLSDGHFQAYGQNLNLTDSEIQFSARRIDDPILDIRAVREIFADPVVEAAGVHIRGTARDPIIELFTDPPTNEEKALAYIVTGADFDHASGQGAFNIGFYLMPRLFVSYGIGLFETGNVLSARYQLSRRWGLRASSGERDTGVDFSYLIDR